MHQLLILYSLFALVLYVFVSVVINNSKKIIPVIQFYLLTQLIVLAWANCMINYYWVHILPPSPAQLFCVCMCRCVHICFVCVCVCVRVCMHMHMYVYLREYIACASPGKCLCVSVNYLASACVGGWMDGDEQT